MPSKRDRDTVKKLEELGFEFDRCNSKGQHFYVHPGRGCEIRFMPGLEDSRAKKLITTAQRLVGVPTKDNKRNAAQIRERNAAEHARAKRELEQARQRRADALVSGNEQLTREAEEAYLNAERQFRFWDRLMRAAS